MKVLLNKFKWGIITCAALTLSFSYHAAVFWSSLEHTFPVPARLVAFFGIVSLLALVATFYIYSRNSRDEDYQAVSLYESVIYTIITGVLLYVYYWLSSLGLFLVDSRMVIGFALLLIFIWGFYLKNPFRRLI